MLFNEGTCPLIMLVGEIKVFLMILRGLGIF